MKTVKDENCNHQKDENCNQQKDENCSTKTIFFKPEVLKKLFMKFFLSSFIHIHLSTLLCSLLPVSSSCFHCSYYAGRLRSFSTKVRAALSHICHVGGFEPETSATTVWRLIFLATHLPTTQRSEVGLVLRDSCDAEINRVRGGGGGRYYMYC